MYTHIWKTTIAKILTMLMIMVLAIDFMPQPASAEVFASKVDSYLASAADIYQGDEVTLKVYLNGFADKLEIIDSTSFKSVTGSNFYSDDPSRGTKMFEMKLLYSGIGNEIRVRVTPLKNDPTGNYPAFEATLVIKGSRETVTKNVNIDLFQIPKQSPVREVMAGTDVPIEMTVNTTGYMSNRDITATIISPVDGSLFKLESSQIESKVVNMGNMSPGATSFRLDIQPTAKSKTYELKIKFSYSNPTGATFVDETSNSYFIKVRNSNIEPTVSVVDMNLTDKAIAAGKSDKVQLVVQNSGTLEANDIRVKLTGFDKDKIKIVGDSDTKSISLLNGGAKQNITYNLAAASSSKTETHELIAEITYTDSNGKDYKTTSKVFVPVIGKDLSAIELRVQNLKMPERTKSKESFAIEFDVKNVSKIDANMVEIGVEYLNTTFIPKSTPKKFIRTLKAGAQEHFRFEFTSKQEAMTGFYDLYTTLKYNVEGGKDAEAQNYKEFAGIYLEGALGLGRPKVIIQNYNFGGANVLAGKEFNLDLELFNTSSDESIKNIKVSLKADDGIFNPVDMSSSFFMPMIGPQETTTKTIKLKTKPDATVKTYNLLVTFLYEDSKGNAYDAQKNPFKEEETIAIPVGQPIRLETSEVTYPPEVFANQPATISMEFFNMGKSPVYNLMVKASGDFQVQGSNYFVGNFEAGRSDFFETMVVPSKEGECIGKVEFIYEDANGEPGVYTKEIKLNVMPMAPIVDPLNPDGGNPDGGNPDGTPVAPLANGKLMIIGILVGIGVLIGGTLMWKRRADRKASARTEDEDE